MNRHAQIANANHEEVTRYTSRDFGGRPIPRTLRVTKRAVNRSAKRQDARWHRDSQEQL